MTCQGDESPIAQNNRQGDAHPNNGITIIAINPIALQFEGVHNEGQSIRQEDLQQMQNHQAQGDRPGHLRKQAT